MTSVNYYAGNKLNRLSYLRTSTSFLNSSLRSPLARFVLLHDLNPLVFLPSDRSSEARSELATVGWDKVKQIIGEEEEGFGFGEDGEVKTQAVGGGLLANADTEGNDSKPILVFLGVEEPTGDSVTSFAKDGSSSPLPPPKEGEITDEVNPAKDTSNESDRIPSGTRSYFALEVTHLPSAVREHIISSFDAQTGISNDGKPAFHDLRTLPIPLEPTSAAVAAEARALTDWNRRNPFCPGCGRQTVSVWAGWKRGCMPDPEDARASADDKKKKKPPCLSRKGVHNFSYPRTDPVAIMAILDPTGENILLGRQKAWPAKFYSCLAGFVEPGESIEEAVRREVWEESGVRVNSVRYHSSQPWPYPGSLMLGCFGQMEEGSVIRTDLDNELEDARCFPKSAVLAALDSSAKSHFSRQELEKLESRTDNSQESNVQQHVDIRLPPRTAIAHVLIEAWARGEFSIDDEPATRTDLTANDPLKGRM